MEIEEILKNTFLIALEANFEGNPSANLDKSIDLMVNTFTRSLPPSETEQKSKTPEKLVFSRVCGQLRMGLEPTTY